MTEMHERPAPQPPEDEAETIDSLQQRLEAADPADAPAIAEELAARLAERLDEEATS
jgi:hypothetical protein